jgi:hypothetical protein
MTMPEPAEVAALTSAAAALVPAHHAQCLSLALRMRLHMDGLDVVAHTLEARALGWSDAGDWGDAGLDAGHVAGALIARLRADGSGELAEALDSLMHRAGAAPVFSNPTIPPFEEMKAYPGAASMLRRRLDGRLRLDGHRELADAVRALFVSDVRDTPPTAAKPEDEASGLKRFKDAFGPNAYPLTEDMLSHPRSVAAANDARSLLDAYIVRLHQDGRAARAGRLTLHWLQAFTGPLIDPRELADALIEAVRNPARGPPSAGGEGAPRGPEPRACRRTGVVAGRRSHRPQIG